MTHHPQADKAAKLEKVGEQYGNAIRKLAEGSHLHEGGNSAFADFFTKATPEEKEKVMLEVARKASEAQRKVVEGVHEGWEEYGLPANAFPPDEPVFAVGTVQAILERVERKAREEERSRIRLKLWATLDTNDEVMPGGREFIEKALTPEKPNPSE